MDGVNKGEIKRECRGERKGKRRGKRMEESEGDINGRWKELKKYSYYPKIYVRL